ncbi:hypothetical protein [Streptococcus suis]|uniref:hypothetical protein n=1 Tax=Streptococcus suis TaxID=1307 RepID=UPI001374BC25|nr:hypothetical protein [Streptococcus suis]
MSKKDLKFLHTFPSQQEIRRTAPSQNFHRLEKSSNSPMKACHQPKGKTESIIFHAQTNQHLKYRKQLHQFSEAHLPIINILK